MGICPYGGPGLGMGMGRFNNAGYGLWLPIAITVIIVVVWFGLDYRKKWYEQDNLKWKYDPAMVAIAGVWIFYLIFRL